jgi:hypothetical protein
MYDFQLAIAKFVKYNANMSNTEQTTAAGV